VSTGGQETRAVEPQTAAAAAASRSVRADLAMTVQRLGLVLAWLALIVFFAIRLTDTFFTRENMATVLGSSAVIAVLALSLLVPLTAGDYDLSGAGTLALAANVVAILNVDRGWPIGWAIVVAVATGMLVGATNGAFVVLFGVDSFIVTLGMLTFLQGIIGWISSSENKTGISSWLTDWTITNRFLNVPLEFYYGLALCVVLWYVLGYTAVGRRLLFVGRGRQVSLLSGIRVGGLRFGALVASGGIAALGGVLYAGTLGGSDPSSGLSYLLPAFAAAFLGATAITPGRFNAWGTFIAVYFLATGINGLQLLGVPNYVQNLFYGGALILAVALSQVVRPPEAGQRRLPTWVLAGALALVVVAFVVLLVVLATTQATA
jgi:ribose transport system permease protein